MTAGARRAAVVVAAGPSERMGRSKAGLPFNPWRAESGTFLDRVVDLAAVCCLAERIVVVGRPGESPQLPEGVTWVVNEHPERGMFSSVQAGLRSVGGAPGPTMLLLVDHPLVLRATIGKLWAAAGKAPEDVVCPVYAGRPGHPVVLPAAVVSAALEAPADGRLDRVIAAFGLEEVAVGDPGVVRDIDTPESYAHFLGLF